jgi:hypothetical protein
VFPLSSNGEQERGWLQEALAPMKREFLVGIPVDWVTMGHLEVEVAEMEDRKGFLGLRWA